ncbi:MAG TPA: hypothetical protein VM891_15635 [Amaricoccus sp.]|nr:hypothetical protein [Amaricoccus sp.]
MCADEADFEAAVRRAFARLVREDLPRAAVARGWPVRSAREFERLLLDHLKDSAADGAGPCLFDLVMAVELGEQMLAGNLCCATMSRRLRCPEVKDPRRADAWKALLGMLDEASRARDGH